MKNKGVYKMDKEYSKILGNIKELQEATYRSNPLYKELAYFRGYEV